MEKIGNRGNMGKAFTKRNKKGIKTKSTLLKGFETMKMYHRQATGTERNSKNYDAEGTLNHMADWLVAVSKCPPRHYGKIWNDEKIKIVRKCQQMYRDAQIFSEVKNDAFMGFVKKNKNQGSGQEGDGRYIPLSRLRYNMATAKWDFTNRAETGKNQYWDDEQAKKKQKVRIIKGNKKSWALNHLSVPLMSRDQDTEDAMRKIVQPYTEWNNLPEIILRNNPPRRDILCKS